MKTWLEPIKELGACQEALDWADKYDSLEEAWAACKEGGWMAWLMCSLLSRATYRVVWDIICDDMPDRPLADIVRKHYPKPPVKEE